MMLIDNGTPIELPLHYEITEFCMINTVLHFKGHDRNYDIL